MKTQSRAKTTHNSLSRVQTKQYKKKQHTTSVLRLREQKKTLAIDFANINYIIEDDIECIDRYILENSLILKFIYLFVCYFQQDHIPSIIFETTKQRIYINSPVGTLLPRNSNSNLNFKFFPHPFGFSLYDKHTNTHRHTIMYTRTQKKQNKTNTKVE